MRVSGAVLEVDKGVIKRNNGTDFEMWLFVGG